MWWGGRLLAPALKTLKGGGCAAPLEWWLRPDPHGAPVRVEFFHRGKRRHDRLAFLHTGAVVMDDAGAALKIGHTQAAEEASCTAGRQHVTRAGREVTESRRRV